jgi:hypothetical protein
MLSAVWGTTEMLEASPIDANDPNATSRPDPARGASSMRPNLFSHSANPELFASKGGCVGVAKGRIFDVRSAGAISEGLFTGTHARPWGAPGLGNVARHRFKALVALLGAVVAGLEQVFAGWFHPRTASVSPRDVLLSSR